MKEETKLKYMKWARILVVNEEKNIPKEVAIFQNSLKFYILIWVPRVKILPEFVRDSTREDDIWPYSVNPIVQRTRTEQSL